MNKVIIAIVISLSLFISPACNNDKKEQTSTGVEVPESVKSAFSANYSTASDIEWVDAHENGKHTYKAKFKVNGQDMKAEFGADGSLIKEKEND